MAPLILHSNLHRVVIVSVIVIVSAFVLGGGLVVSNARAIGDSVTSQAEPATTTPPVAQRRWYARARFLTPDGVVTPVPDYADDSEGPR